MKTNQHDLIQRILQGNRNGFEDIIAWYSDDVMRQAYSLMWDREEAQDVFQESLLRLLRMIKQNKLHESNGSIKGLLMKIARNLCIDKLRKKVDFQSIDHSEGPVPAEMTNERTPDRITDEKRFEKQFHDGLSRLSHAQRTIMVLHELNGESYTHIAETLNISTDCVKMQLYRARKNMRIILEAFL